MSTLIEKYNSDKRTTHILDEYIYDFTKNLNDKKGFKERTIYLHIKYVEMFDRYLYYFKNEYSINDINENTIEEYKNFCLLDLKNTHKTINKKLNTLTRFFAYLTKDLKLYPYNFMLNISLLKNEEEHDPTIINSNELNILFGIMRNYIYGCRDISISKLILETGMLTKDILNLKILQLSTEEGTLSIIRKNKTIIYKLSSNLIKDLNSYLASRNLLDKHENPYLFLSRRGNKYSIRSYQMFFEEAMKRSELKYFYTPRHLRSTFIYNMSKYVTQEKLKVIAQQEKVNQYYELRSNPLRHLD